MVFRASVVVKVYASHVSRGKQHRESFSESNLPIGAGTLSRYLGGAEYFVLIVDDFNRFTLVYMFRSKDESFECFQDWRTLAKKESGY